jgi:hypothetical protein
MADDFFAQGAWARMSAISTVPAENADRRPPDRRTFGDRRAQIAPGRAIAQSIRLPWGWKRYMCSHPRGAPACNP